MTLKGNPVCVLPDPCDLSGLDSRSWEETVTLTDGWSGLARRPKNNERSKVTSALLGEPFPKVDHHFEDDGGVLVEAQLVGGEIASQQESE